MSVPATTKRLLATEAALKPAWEAMAAAVANGSAEDIAIAKAAYERAVLEHSEAMLEATARKRGPTGAAKRDAIKNLDQARQRESVFQKLQIDSLVVESPEKNARLGASTFVKPWAGKALNLWAEHCGALGPSTVTRWLIVSGLLRLGKPPGWDGEWPPEDKEM